MNKNIYTDLEDARRTMEKKMRSFCPHCGVLQYASDVVWFTRLSDIVEYIPYKCRCCHKRQYVNKVFLLLLLAETVSFISALFLWSQPNLRTLAKIVTALFGALGVIIVVLDRLDTPRTYFTNLLNRKEQGQRICIKTHRKIHKGGVFRRGQMYEITPADKRYKSGSMIVQADKVTSDTLTVRIVKSDMFFAEIGENVLVQPSLIEGVYGTICDKFEIK